MLESRIKDKINSIVKSAIYDEPMSAHTTLRVGGNADCYISVASETEIRDIFSLCKEEQIDYFIVGNGSNLLFSDNGFRGIIVEIGRDFSGIRLDNNIITVKAGTLLSRVSRFALENELTGLEFASGIPGTVGGAIIMNAGAYGGEMCQVVQSVKLMNHDGEIITLNNQEMEFGYRYSKAKAEGMIVIESVLELTMGDKEKIESRMNELAASRREKQPLEYPSAGSTFKRPEGYFAGKLISDCNLKGFTVGGAQVSEKHAGFVINIGGASADDVYDLIQQVEETVLRETGVQLEPEVIMVGFA